MEPHVCSLKAAGPETAGSVQVVPSEQAGAEGGDGVTEGSNFKQPGCERLSLLVYSVTYLNLVPKDNATHLILLF